MVISLSFVVYVICVHLYVTPFCEIVFLGSKHPVDIRNGAVLCYTYKFTVLHYVADDAILVAHSSTCYICGFAS